LRTTALDGSFFFKPNNSLFRNDAVNLAEKLLLDNQVIRSVRHCRLRQVGAMPT